MCHTEYLLPYNELVSNGTDAPWSSGVEVSVEKTSRSEFDSSDDPPRSHKMSLSIPRDLLNWISRRT